MPSYECLQLTSRTRDDIRAVLGSLLSLVLRNTIPLWKGGCLLLQKSKHICTQGEERDKALSLPSL